MAGPDPTGGRRDGDSAPLSIAVLVEAGDWPEERELRAIAARAVSAACAELSISSDGDTELSIVFTDDAHIRTLNAEWRGKDQPTNVLSFPAFPQAGADRLPPMLGDIILAKETIAREAELEDKPFEHHLTHLIVHGFLHLLGHDHETDEQAGEMEGVERRVLTALAIPDPYALTGSGD
jgi:probable rRNA maturation factor